MANFSWRGEIVAKVLKYHSFLSPLLKGGIGQFLIYQERGDFGLFAYSGGRGKGGKAKFQGGVTVTFVFSFLFFVDSGGLSVSVYLYCNFAYFSKYFSDMIRFCQQGIWSPVMIKHMHRQAYYPGGSGQ